VGDTFNSSVLESDKWVFIKFTAPWCEKCKKLKPEFEEIAGELAADPRIQLADFDVTENDYWPSYVASGYPCLLLFPPDDKTKPFQCEEFYSAMRIRKFLNKRIPDVHLVVDEAVIKAEDEKREEERQKYDAEHHDL
jgi:thiol-disulfide isomerase/thioredoxin